MCTGHQANRCLGPHRNIALCGRVAQPLSLEHQRTHKSPGWAQTQRQLARYMKGCLATSHLQDPALVSALRPGTGDHVGATRQCPGGTLGFRHLDGDVTVPCALTAPPAVTRWVKSRQEAAGTSRSRLMRPDEKAHPGPHRQPRDASNPARSAARSIVDRRVRERLGGSGICERVGGRGRLR
ncbi:hypothetical protein NDU88_004403 [Pleurodeles waltl]|uniref:Uncharacterized protein n=1 Tax=Pleurodeles waltl TaxID=8319 RepID=A0AAV7QBV9_PLEWA|nr:hypothetical protein NDU88_004403 [Pleurodeles waltl]